ncbi:hypothetical protein K505DRAFT_103856 [Melanomma pulvis-pyrius CBS 109.77]|uniref:Uncharacterized protein n=1 Tax=Melanomma pulvis-pyrius CBS 109.77 TaxID=1314802 RepID=A0A6A6WXB5_9PLEO|nr:hypothetical protein K505DRAFT_103856 [Melanomma pulvis-pyrius CBS 109.77]
MSRTARQSTTHKHSAAMSARLQQRCVDHGQPSTGGAVPRTLPVGGRTRKPLDIERRTLRRAIEAREEEPLAPQYDLLRRERERETPFVRRAGKESCRLSIARQRLASTHDAENLVERLWHTAPPSRKFFSAAARGCRTYAGVEKSSALEARRKLEAVVDRQER